MQNAGKLDRLVRAGLGMILFSVYLLEVVARHSDMRVLGLAATLLFLTALLGYCPVYGLTGINTINPDQLKFLSLKLKALHWRQAGS